jgi:hypothetical protein
VLSEFEIENSYSGRPDYRDELLLQAHSRTGGQPSRLKGYFYEYSNRKDAPRILGISTLTRVR